MSIDGPPDPPETAADALKRLRHAYESGRTRPTAWRREQLAQLRRLLDDGGDELVETVQRDLGKPALEAFVTELAFVKTELAEAQRNLDRWLRPERVRVPLTQMPGRARIEREPLGVVLVIAPWNYPVQLVLAPLVGAIAAGNCAVLKPSEVSAHTSRAIARLVARHLDPECFAVVEGGVPETTALLDEQWDHIFYTGNGTVARVVMAAAAKHLTPVTLELGGKSPAIVDASADLDVTARRIVWGKFINAGQTCVAPDYVLVDRRVERLLLTRMREAVLELYGVEPRQSADYGRIIDDRHFDRVVALLDGDGAGELVCGGDREREARYIAPTILRATAPDAAVMREEIFGPVLPVLAVEDLDDAVRFVNGRERPLALYVFSRDEVAADAVVQATSSGGVCVNHTVMHLAVPALPFGGVGPSGTGAYHGRATFETFSHRKSVLTKPTRIDPSLAYPPYTRWKQLIIRRLL